MSQVLIVGAGGVDRAVAHRCAQIQKVFDDILLPATKSKCDRIAAQLPRRIDAA